MGYIIGFAICIVIAILIMAATNVFYDILVVLMPLLLAVMGLVGVFIGLWVAIKNTFKVYKAVFFGRGQK
ncbi:MAG: hypothetical protein E7459_06110 [Ruminococcaceae bacterium]|nr:hypothetical protein [Oscillospiraceae bacterium]